MRILAAGELGSQGRPRAGPDTQLLRQLFFHGRAGPPCPYNSSILKGVAFEWDARKNAANRRKHGIDFVDAVRIFDGPIVEGPDEREDQEVRVIAFGALGLRVIAVVYTWRGETCRIVSARRATSNEREAYYQALHGQADV